MQAFYGMHHAEAQKLQPEASLQCLVHDESWAHRRVIEEVMKRLKGTPAEGRVSYADLIALGGAYAVALTGGPAIDIPIGALCTSAIKDCGPSPVFLGRNVFSDLRYQQCCHALLCHRTCAQRQTPARKVQGLQSSPDCTLFLLPWYPARLYPCYW